MWNGMSFGSRYVTTMQLIARRELRNASAAILRRAEAGERFVITVDGRLRGVLDTSVIIATGASLLPDESAIYKA